MFLKFLIGFEFEALPVIDRELLLKYGQQLSEDQSYRSIDAQQLRNSDISSKGFLYVLDQALDDKADTVIREYIDSRYSL